MIAEIWGSAWVNYIRMQMFLMQLNAKSNKCWHLGEAGHPNPLLTLSQGFRRDTYEKWIDGMDEDDTSLVVETMWYMYLGI